jgi:cell division protein FtsB
MTAEPTPERNPLRPFVGITLALLLLLLVAGGMKSYSDLRQARQRVAELEQEIGVAKSRIETLERFIRRLETDPNILERLAREELGLVEPGDVVIVLPEEPVPAPPADEPLAP